MKRFTTSFTLLLAAGTLISARAADDAAAPASSPSAKISELFTNDIVAKGKNLSISRSQLDEAMVEIKTSLAAQGRSIPPAQLSMIEARVLKELIDIKLLSGKASEADQAEAKDKVEKTIAQFKTQLGSDEAFQKQLKLSGLTEAGLRAKLTEKFAANTYLKRELNVTVTDEEAKKFYDENPGQFETPETVKAAHVLISTQDQATHTDLSDEQKAAKKKIAENVLKRAKAGEDFAKLAKEYSDDPGSKDSGGEYTFPRGKMVPEFEEAAFSMSTNQISDIVTTQFGYHIIKLLEKHPAKKIGFDEAKADIKEYLVGLAIQKQLPDYVAKLEKEADVQILDEKLKAVELPKETADPEAK